MQIFFCIKRRNEAEKPIEERQNIKEINYKKLMDEKGIIL